MDSQKVAVHVRPASGTALLEVRDTSQLGALPRSASSIQPEVSRSNPAASIPASGFAKSSAEPSSSGAEAAERGATAAAADRPRQSVPGAVQGEAHTSVHTSAHTSTQTSTQSSATGVGVDEGRLFTPSDRVTAPAGIPSPLSMQPGEREQAGSPLSRRPSRSHTSTLEGEDRSSFSSSSVRASRLSHGASGLGGGEAEGRWVALGEEDTRRVKMGATLRLGGCLVLQLAIRVSVGVRVSEVGWGGKEKAEGRWVALGEEDMHRVKVGAMLRSGGCLVLQLAIRVSVGGGVS